MYGVRKKHEYPLYRPFHAYVEPLTFSAKDYYVKHVDYCLKIKFKIVAGINTPTNELTSNMNLYVNVEDPINLFMKIYDFFSNKQEIEYSPDEIIMDGFRRPASEYPRGAFEMELTNVNISQDIITGEEFGIKQLEYLTNIEDSPYLAIQKSTIIEKMNSLMMDIDFNESIFQVYTIVCISKKLSFVLPQILQQLMISTGVPFTIIEEKQIVKKI